MKAKKLVIVAAVVVFVLVAALAAVPFFVDKQSLKTKLVTEAEGSCTAGCQSRMLRSPFLRDSAFG